ncbi:MAG: DUF4870 domain-containing protein [Phycisphaeraceae bacterium]|nr:DUF4870 domain-containing protein [Phycisphaeraceae bacterium]
MPYDPARAPITPLTDQERTWATLTHLLSGALAVATPVPGIIVALVLWLVKKDESSFLDDHGREAVNFWISVFLYALVIIPLATVLTCGMGVLLYIPMFIIAVIAVIQATMAASRGEFYRYPMTIRLI